MNRKLRVMILAVVLTVLMFGGNRLLAESAENKPVESPQTAPTEENLESNNEGEKGASLVEEGKNTDIDSNEAEAKEDAGKTESTEAEAKEDAGKTESTEAEANKNTNTEVSEPKANEDAPKAKEEEKTEANADAKPAAKEAEKPAETPDVKAAEKTAAGNGPEDGAKLQAAPAKAPEAQGTPAKAPAEGEGKKDKQEVNPDANPNLKALQEQIDKEQDPKKKAELQKKYNDKYLEEIGKSEKLNKDILNRFTDAEKTKRYYELKDEYDKLAAQAKNEKLNQKQLDEIKAKLDTLNKELGEYEVPRKLDTDEKGAQDKLAESVEVPGLQDGASQDARDKLAAYNAAKSALKDALDPEKARSTTAEELKKLLDDFNKAEKDLKAGIENGDIKPSYTKRDPTVRVFPLTNGSVGKELTNDPATDDPYYIPDNTSIELLVHVNKNENPKDFTFTIRAINQGAVVEGEKASNLAFLNGNPVDLVRNEDGSYSFTVSSANMNFGIAQLRFNVPGFEGPFHKGFDLEMDLGDNNKVTKQFRITKKGYEDEANLNGPGSDSADDPTKIPEVDAGDTENAKVKKDSAKEVLDFFTYLKKSNTYIDQVTFNSGNGQSLPLDSVDITITVPKSGENNFAEMIHKSGLKYDLIDAKKGKYRLKLDRKVFGDNLTKKDGKFYLKGENGQADKELTEANLKDVLLENAGKKVYVDENGDAHDIITSEVLTDKNGDYKVENGKLYKKNDKDSSKFDEIGTFDKDGKIKTDSITYALKDGKLISYTKEHDVYDGNVVNKEDKDGNYKADPNVTPTYEGNQVTIKTEVTKNGETKTETSYGGTIVEDAIYDKNGKIFNEKDYNGQAGTFLIGPDGKAVTSITYDSKDIKEDKKTGVKIVTVDKVSYHIVENPVFKNGYIIDGLEYKKGLSLIDKFGKKMDVEVSKDDTTGIYTFTRKVKDKNGSETKEKEVKSGKKDNRNVIVGTGKQQILVNSKNEVVKDDGYTKIGPKYYYDGEKFVEAKGNGLQGNKFFEDFKEFILKKTTTYSYMDGKEQKEIKNFADKKVYEGSLKPKDYFKVDEKVYVKKSQGAGSSQTDYYVSADPNASNEILSVKQIAKIVQTLGDVEKVTDETDIFDAVQNAKFALRFPGFLAGKNIVYNVHADVKATYKKPKAGQKGEFENVDVVTDNGIKKVDKFFTLKNEKTTNTTFFKYAPKELKADPAVNLHFFNIFYRNADDRQRDKLIVDLLAKEDDLKKAEDKVNDAKSDKAKKEAQDAVDKFKKENKEELALIAKFKEELKRLYNNATFYVAEDNNGVKTLVIKDKDGNVIEADELNKMRSLLWEVGFKNEEGTLFPKNPDTEIIIEDHNMDNRLIYDEIIVNDTRKNWKNAKDAFEKDPKNKDKKFGNEEYFFLDQIKDIRLGVNPNYIDGRFVPLGKDFCITGDEIIKKLGEDKEVTITKGGIDFKITRDKDNGQVRIKVMNAFYKKNISGQEGYNKDLNKFYSPAQKVYQDKIDSLLKQADSLNNENIEAFVKLLHDEKSECFGIIKEKLTEEFKKVKDNTNDLNKFKEKLKTEIEKIKLEYLDKSKHIENGKSVYKYDDMRFNAIRIGLNPNITIGGAMNPENTKKIGITSVIIPEIDIPYTDEFGNLLTNKGMYVKAEIEKILKDGIAQGKGEKPKKYTEADLKNEEKFREIMDAAYERVNAKGEDTFKKLVIVEDSNKDKVGMEKYTVKNGSDLKLDDLAVDGKVLKNKDGFAINPWFIEKGDKAKSVKDIFEEKFGAGYDKMPEYLELEKMPIDIAAYYMSKQGYDRNKYANQANYKLSGGDKKDGIFGSDSDWHKKICYPGLGHCIEQAGKNPTDGKNPDQGKFGAEEEKGADFELTYEPTNKGPDKENPKTDKSSTAPNDGIDITGEEDKKVDFNIYVTVDKMTKEQKDIADALTPEKPEKPKKPEAEMTEEEKKAAEEEKKAAEAEKKAKEIEAKNYKENGYYEYKNSLIIDFLPEIFKLKQGKTTLTLNVDRKKLMENDANKAFDDKKKFDEWKNDIEYFYTDDLLAYAESLEDKEKAAVLKKAIEDAKASGKIKEGQKVQAVLAWVPTFEAPHGSKEQFKFELKNVYVDKKKYKDFVDNVIGTNYTNHAAFGDKARFYFGKTTVNIHENPKGKVNKYLQLLDKDGHVIDKDRAEGWFKGNAELKFGDKFNYRIEYHNNTGVVAVPGEANNKSEIKLEDLFASVTEKGLRPVLNGFIISDFEFEHQVKVIYKVDKEEYTKGQLEKAIEANKVKFSDVTSVVLEGKYENGATHNFYIPMMIPNLDAKIENGKVVYIGTDGEKHELGKAEDFFNLKNLKDPKAEMAFDNSIDGSNTVTVYLEKNRFIRLFKEFFDRHGKEITKNRPEMKFEIYQYQTDEKGNKISEKVKALDKNGKPLQLIVNEENKFTDMVNNLPLFKKIIEFKKDSLDDKGNVVKGKTIEKTTYYKYELKEVNSTGYKVEFETIDKGEDELGFVIKAKNTELPPETPPGPNENPKNFKIRFSVNKVWKVLNGGATPSIQVELYANGKATGKVLTLGANGSWSASFEDLPAKDADGKDIVYTVREVGETKGITKIGEREFEVEYVGSIEEGFTIRNNEVPHEEPHEDPHEEPHENPHEDPHEDPHDDNIIPKTGVSEDLSSIYFAFVLLLALVFIKRKYLAD